MKENIHHKNGGENSNGNGKVIVGIHEFAPFIMKSGNHYVGFDIEIWEHISKKLNLKFTYKNISLPGIFKKLQNKSIDVGLAGITITTERQKMVGFSQPYFESSHLIAVPNSLGLDLKAVIKSMTTRRVVKWLSFFFLFIFIMGNIYWLAEKGASISELYTTGIFDSLWFVVVTVTTVGYGDLTPDGTLGRLIALLLMLVGVSIFGALTAQISSRMILKKLKTDIISYKNLAGHKVATKKGSRSETILHEIGASVLTTHNITDAYKKLENKEIDAVMFDSASITHYTKNEGKDKVNIAGSKFRNGHYGIAVPIGSNLRRKIDHVLLQMRDDGTYDEIYEHWFGQPDF